ncbi:unnamed protein product [Cylindrotheca closterium]|uniref:Uncharacterized protein n=1 Tax=Cylindrotheca closterium TaxID=2856 RepID=A0AAD2FQV3_9STRA|nr:unnamed protein product [Cylindrotheca closterium]
MGKTSRRNNRNTSGATPGVANRASAAVAPVAAPPPTQSQANVYYPSDGPSDVELLQTTSQSLQAKLNQLTELGLANDRAGFVQHFVPLDLSPGDTECYLQQLRTDPEAEGQWRNLVAEIAAIRSGHGVDRIEGDQVTRATFFFSHPLLDKCDREVCFVCVNGEWRADG